MNEPSTYLEAAPIRYPEQRPWDGSALGLSMVSVGSSGGKQIKLTWRDSMKALLGANKAWGGHPDD